MDVMGEQTRTGTVSFPSSDGVNYDLRCSFRTDDNKKSDLGFLAGLPSARPWTTSRMRQNAPSRRHGMLLSQVPVTDAPGSRRVLPSHGRGAACAPGGAAPVGGDVRGRA